MLQRDEVKGLHYNCYFQWYILYPCKCMDRNWCAHSSGCIYS